MLTSSNRDLLGACLVITLLAIPGDTGAGLAAGGQAQQDLVLDLMAVVDQREQSVDGPFKLDDLVQTIEVPVPTLGDDRDSMELFAQVVVSNGVPKGHMRAVVSRVRDGRSRRLGSVGSKFGPTIADPPLGSALFFLEIDPRELETGDVLTVTFTFSTGGHQMRRGDTVFVAATLDFTAVDGLGPVRSGGVPFLGARDAADKLSVTARTAGSQRGRAYELEAGTTLDELSTELEMPMVLSLDGSFADELLFFVLAGVSTEGIGPRQDSAPPQGRVRIRLVRYPADGSRRQILYGTSLKMSGGAQAIESVPTPAGFGSEDRIVIEVFFKGDWAVPADGALMQALAQFVPVHDGLVVRQPSGSMAAQ